LFDENIISPILRQRKISFGLKKSERGQNAEWKKSTFDIKIANVYPYRGV